MQTWIRMLLGATLIAVVSGCMSQASQPNIAAELKAIPNIHHPVANHYTSGQPDLSDLQRLKQAGVTTVVNLLTDADMGGDYEAQWAAQLDLNYHRVPVGGGQDLTRANVAALDQIINQNSDEILLLHCSSSNRVGAMMALRAAWHQGASIEAAIQTGKDYGLNDLQPKVEELLSQ